MRFSFSPALLAFTCLAAVMVAKPATAQIVIGGEPKRPAVEVDLGALEQLAKAAGVDIVPRPAPRPAGSITATPMAPPRSEPRPLVAAPAIVKPAAPTVQVAQPARPTAPALAQPAPRVVAAPLPTTSQAVAARPPTNQPAAPQTGAGQPAPAARNTPAPTTQIAALAPAPTTPAPAASRTTATPAASRPVEAPPATGRNSALRLTYTPGATALSDGTRSQITDIVRQLEANSSARVEIAAFASGTPERPSDARRLSLTRALEIRGILIDSGVRSTRIDVRALGADAQGGPADRVDLTIKG